MKDRFALVRRNRTVLSNDVARRPYVSHESRVEIKPSFFLISTLAQGFFGFYARELRLFIREKASKTRLTNAQQPLKIFVL